MSGEAIAKIDCWADFSTVLRARADSLGITRQQIDEISGLQPGYSAKLLSTVPGRHFAGMSFDAIIGTLGVKFIMIEDEAATERTRKRMTLRKVAQPMPSAASHRPITTIISRNRLRNLAKKGGKARLVKMSAKQRKESARHAAKQRWEKVRELQRRREERLRLKAELAAQAAAAPNHLSDSQGTCQNLSSPRTP